MIGHGGTLSKCSKTIIIKNLLGTSGAGNVFFLRRSCTSGYKHETFRLCSSNLTCKYFLVSHRKCFQFQDGLRKFQDGCQIHMLSRAESDKKKAHADISMKLGKMFMSMSNLNIYH